VTKQHIVETKPTLQERFIKNRQATNNRSHASPSAAVPTHFNLSDHSIKDMTLVPLEPQPIQYLLQENKGGLSDTQGPNARTMWNEKTK